MILLAFTRVIVAYYYLEIQNFDDEEQKKNIQPAAKASQILQLWLYGKEHGNPSTWMMVFKDANLLRDACIIDVGHKAKSGHFQIIHPEISKDSGRYLLEYKINKSRGMVSDMLSMKCYEAV